MEGLYNTFVLGKAIAVKVLAIAIIIAIILLMVVLVIILNSGTRKIPVQYAKKMQGRKFVGGQSTNIPLKVNTAGVIPIIFASSIMEFPTVICSLFGINGTGIWAEILKGMSSQNWCNPKAPLYSIGLVVYILLVIFFAYFYTSITFNPLMIADNMKKQGGFIPGIRPGKPTSDYLNKVLQDRLQKFLCKGGKGLCLFGTLFQLPRQRKLYGFRKGSLQGLVRLLRASRQRHFVLYKVSGQARKRGRKSDLNDAPLQLLRHTQSDQFPFQKVHQGRQKPYCTQYRFQPDNRIQHRLLKRLCLRCYLQDLQRQAL
jgi:hypothetical protein